VSLWCKLWSAQTRFNVCGWQCTYCGILDMEVEVGHNFEGIWKTFLLMVVVVLCRKYLDCQRLLWYILLRNLRDMVEV
jgi:hypothetical protein